jgi:hypothetical protein
MSTTSFLAQHLVAAWSPPFRGQIYEYARKLSLGEGYAVKGLVEINTLRHLVQPLRAIRNPRVRMVSAMGAVQTTKSLMADLTVPYWIEHDPGDCLWLMEDDPKAKLYAARCIPLIRSIPDIAALLDDVDRSDKTKTRLRFSHMQVVLAGLNPGNVQSLSWRYIIVDETWLHPFDGLIRQAIDRTKQYADTCKVILLGQGGVEGDDHDRIHKETDQRELHYACPRCGYYQPFELSRQRPEDFLPAQITSPGYTPPTPGTYAGLSWDSTEVTRPNGRWNYELVGRTAHHRCYACDHRIDDLPEVRRQLNDSYCYFPAGTPEAAKEEFRQRATATNFDDLHEQMFPFGERVGFQWPAEASMRLSFSSLVQKYLRAKVSAEEMAYKLPLQEFWQKDRGRPWGTSVETDYKTIVQEPYDVKSDWPEEAYRFLVADCQRDLKKFYYQVFAVALNGESRELARGIAGAFGDPPGKSKPESNPDPELVTLAGVQAKWQVKDQRVFLDCGYEMTKVLRECVRHGHVASVKVAGKVRKLWLSWTGLKGSGSETFCHINPRTKVKEFRIFSERKWYNTSVGTSERLPRAPWYEISNLHCKDLLAARRDADASAPKFHTLPEDLPPTDLNSYFSQMRSEYRAEIYNGGKKRSIWLPVQKGRPNHFWDTGQMFMGVNAIVGVIGGSAAEESDPEPS